MTPLLIGRRRALLPKLVYALFQVAGLERDLQTVLFGRERARCIGCERARGIVRLVEVQHDLSLFRQIGVEKAAGAVGGLARSEVAKDEKQLIVLENGV